MQTTRGIDLEIAQYLPRLSDQQKQAVLDVVKSFAIDLQDGENETGKQQNKAGNSFEIKTVKPIAPDALGRKYRKWLKK